MGSGAISITKFNHVYFKKTSDFESSSREFSKEFLEAKRNKSAYR